MLKDFTLRQPKLLEKENEPRFMNSLCTGDLSAHGQAGGLCTLASECSSHQMQEKLREVEEHDQGEAIPGLGGSRAVLQRLF